MNYARTEHNTVAQVLRVDPSMIFDESFASQFRPCGDEVEVHWLWDGDTFAAPPTAPAEIPQVVTMRQARRALRQAGIYEAVNAAIAAMPGDAGVDARIDWEFSSEVQRNQPLVLALGPALGLDAVQLDALFTAASTL